MNKSHSDDETTGIGTVIEPNVKCNGCLHYVQNKTLCLKGLVPNSCGDGSAPEVGYAPVVVDAAAYQEWRAKRGLAHNAPRSTVSPLGNTSGSGRPDDTDRSGPDLVIQVLGDEGHMDLGKGAFNRKKNTNSSNPKTWGGGIDWAKRGAKALRTYAKNSKPTKKVSVKKGGTAPMPKLKAPGMKQGYAGEDVDATKHTNIKPIDTHNPKRGAGPQATEQSKHADWAPGKTVVGAKVNPSKSPILHEVRRRHMQNPSPASQYKAAQAAGGKVFSHKQLAAHVGMKPEHIADLAHASDHVHDFHNKVRAEFGDKAKNLTSGQIRSAYHSTGLMHSMNPDVSKGSIGPSAQPYSRIVSHHGIYSHDTKTMSFKPKKFFQKLLGLKPEKFKIPKNGTQPKGFYSAASHALHTHMNKVEAVHDKWARERPGANPAKIPKAKKSLTTMDLDLIKAHKHGKRCVIGHTSTGKPIHSDAHGAEGYNEEEHREAEEIHRDIGERLLDAAHGVGTYGPGRKLPHAARKYLGEIAQKHSLIGRRHGKTAMDHSSARYAKERASSGGYVEPQAFLSDAAKSLSVALSNNPTDAEIAKAIEAGGGGEALVESMEVRAPMNVRNPLEGKLILGKPSPTRNS